MLFAAWRSAPKRLEMVITSSHIQHWNNHTVNIKPGKENNDVYAKFYPVLCFSRYDVTDIILVVCLISNIHGVLL